MKVAFVLVFASTLAVASVTAHFTGHQERGYSPITGKFGWNCKYKHNNKEFWRFFTGSCPSSIQVE